MSQHLLALVAVIGSFYIWWTKKDAFNRRMLWIFIALGLVDIWDYISNNVLHLSGSVGLINKYAVVVAWAIWVVVVCILLPKYIRNQKKVDDDHRS